MTQIPVPPNMHTPRGPSAGRVERRMILPSQRFSTVSKMLTVNTQTEILRAEGQRVEVYALLMAETSGTNTTMTVRKRPLDEADANDQRLMAGTTIAASTVNETFASKGQHPIMVLEPGEALFLTASAGNRIVYTLTTAVGV